MGVEDAASVRRPEALGASPAKQEGASYHPASEGGTFVQSQKRKESGDREGCKPGKGRCGAGEL